MPKSPRKAPLGAAHQRRQEYGAWLPWATAETLCRLKLRPPSAWQVFLAVMLTNARYNGRAAHLGVADLAKMTGLSLSTVKRALANLLKGGLLVRPERNQRLQAVLGPVQEPTGSVNKLVSPKAGRGVDKLALPKEKVLPREVPVR